MQKIKRNKRGFTMIEISLAMVFISVLSVTIVVIVVNAISSYRRGLTLNDINTGGMSLVDDFKAAIQASPARALKNECTEIYAGEVAKKCTNDNGMSLGWMERKGTVQVGDETINEVPLAGVFCTGSYSYLWNSGYFYNTDDFSIVSGQGVKLAYRMEGMSNSGKEVWDFKLLKVNDPDRMVCKKAAGYDSTNETTGGTYRASDDYYAMPSEINITNILIDEEPEDLLGSEKSFSNLALYDLTMALPVKVEGGNNMFYAVSFVLGTLQGGPNIMATANNCSPPMDYENRVANFDYCAINKFNFAVQAIGG